MHNLARKIQVNGTCDARSRVTIIYIDTEKPRFHSIVSQ